jgi:hypothetical protein
MKDSRCTYRVLSNIVLTTDHRVYKPGAIVDMSHLPEESIRYFVERGYIETADGEPENVPQPTENARRARGCCDEGE